MNMSNIIPLVIAPETIQAIEKALNDAIKKSASEINNGTKIKPYMNIKEASEYIGVSYNTFRKLVKGGLKTVTVEGIEMVRKVDIDNYFEENIK